MSVEVNNHSLCRMPYPASVNLYADWLAAEGNCDFPANDLNRCQIAGPGGLQLLTIPIEGGGKSLAHKEFSEIRISEHGNWRLNHWRAIFSAYGKAPFFEHYAHLFEPLYAQQWTLLADFNYALHNAICNIIDFNAAFSLLNKNLSNPTALKIIDNFSSYTQVRDDKFGFLPSLSILDAIFNIGRESIFHIAHLAYKQSDL